jgi:ankyrin repeat protein
LLLGFSGAALGSPADGALAEAAERREWNEVQTLVESGADIGAAQPDGMTALHWAAHWGNREAVRRLLEAGAEVDAATRYRVTPLALALNPGHEKAAALMLDAGADANTTLAGGETLLMRAARVGAAESVRLLLAHGAEANRQDVNHQTALMWAAAEGNVEALDLLVEAGADVEKSTDAGFSAMMFAAREGRIEAVKRLLEAGADINAVMRPKKSPERAPRSGMSALMLAVESGHFELAALLVELGADPNDQRSGYTPLHALSWVRKANRGDNPAGDPEPRGSGKLTSLGFVSRLVELGADVNAQHNNGKPRRAELTMRGATPFLLAANTADLAYMKRLVELGADPQLSNADGCTPLIAAAGIGVVAVGEEAGTEPEVIEAVRYLVELGADVNAVDNNRETAMHGAAYRNYPRLVAELAGLGADAEAWDHKNRYGWTPVAIAQGHRPGSFKPSPETIQALQAAKSR